MFPSFVEHPHNMRFEGQDPDENIILLLRAHPVTTLYWIIPAVILFLVPFYLPNVLPFLGINLSFVPQTYILASLLINYLLVLVIIFEGFLSWYFNVNILTDKKLIDIDFYSILLKHIDHALLRDVQEASARVGGLLQMIFNYGDIIVQTAASQEGIDYKNIPKPDRVADMIMDEALKNRE